MSEAPLPDGASLLFGAVVRPPHIAWDVMPPRSAQLLHVDQAAARASPGVVDVVVRGNFVGVVATSAQAAEQGAARLRLRWSAPVPAGRGRPVVTAVIAERGEPGGAGVGGMVVDATYRWPLTPPLNASGWAIADCRGDALTVWSSVDATAGLQAELATLAGIACAQVQLVCMAGHDGNPEGRHAAADAVLLSRAVNRPVRVALAPAQIGVGEGYTLVSRITAAVDAAQQVASYHMLTGATPPSAPPLALLLAGLVSPESQIMSVAPGAMPPYAYRAARISAAGAVGAAPLAYPGPGVTAAYVFAHESHVDAMAAATGADPVAMRLALMDDARGIALLRQVADRAGWTGTTSVRQAAGAVTGRGVAYTSVIDNDAGNAYAAWVVDVTVDRSTGDVAITHVVVGHDSGAISSPLPSDRLLESAAMAEASGFTADAPTFDTWSGDPGSLPAVVGTLPSTGASPHAAPLLRGGGTAMLPAAAAVANAIHDATGVRMREPPFSPARVRDALARHERVPRRKRGALAAAAAVATIVAAAFPWRAPIAPVAAPPAGFYSAQTIERGRLVAAAGDCAVCHTAPNGRVNAGGLALDTPFGTIYSTNITPDAATGIGAWSYPAFERAMREGVHRDGRRLYPAFPYTAFAKVSDTDMQSLYAYLMSQPAVAAKPPETRLAFPFSVRPLLAGWNLLFHHEQAFKPDPAKSVEWNRGAYLAEGLGHCGACHSPRNALGGEKRGKLALTGGQAEGWDAPSLTALSAAPVPWDREALYRYLRDGYSPLHGPAAGPMAPVVESLAALPDSDIRAIATYIASFSEAPPAEALAARAATLRQQSQAVAGRLTGQGADLFAGACAVCHQAGQGTEVFGEKVALALNTNLHAARPDNLIHVLMHGVSTSASSEIGAMPGFADSLSDRQMTVLVDYLRQLYAPQQPAWTNVGDTVARIRATVH